MSPNREQTYNAIHSKAGKYTRVHQNMFMDILSNLYVNLTLLMVLKKTYFARRNADPVRYECNADFS